MILQYQEQIAEVLDIEERLQELSLAYKTELVISSTKPILIESGQKIEGKEAIFYSFTGDCR